jgi:hypothetical protein
LIDTVLTRELARIPESGTARLVVRWDRETGWGHLAIAGTGTGAPRFVGFHRFVNGGDDTVLAELATAGCVTTSAPRLADDDFMELDAVLDRGEVARNAVR